MSKLGSRFHKTVAAAATVSLCLVLGGCIGNPPVEPPEAETGPRTGGTAVIGSISDIDSWNEYLSRQTFANSVHRRIFSRLVRERGDCSEQPYSHEPELAESWTTSEDGLALTFRLREAVWSDGEPIRASDVRFTWKAQTSAEVAWGLVTSKDHITDVEVLDDRTVTFHFDRVYPYQMEDANQGGIVPEHVFGAVPFDQWREFDWSTIRVASGPFVLEDHRPG